MSKMRLKNYSVRLPESLARVVDEYLKVGAYVTPSDFIRDAIREKLKRDTLELYESMFQKDLTFRERK